MAQPFEGVRVLEIGGTVAAAGATKTLSDFGADVIKVEPPDGGEVRRLPPFPEDVPHIDRGAFHLGLDNGKRSIVVDRSSPSGLDIVLGLASRADLVVTQLPLGESETLLSALEGIGDSGPTSVTLTPHGQDGPFAGRIENDMSIFASSGRMSRHSHEGAEPLRYAPQVPTLQWAATAAAVASGAIWGRRKDGLRRRIEVSGVESLAGNVDSQLLMWTFAGVLAERPSGPSATRYPNGYLQCKDGLIVVASSNEPFFTRFCGAIGHPELAQDPRFTNLQERPNHFDEFMSYLQPYLDARTRDELFTELQSHGIIVAPLLDVREAMADRQAVARGSYVDYEQPGIGTHTIPGPPFRIPDGWQVRPAPSLGQHTSEILGELSYSKAEQIALFRAGVTM